MSKKEIFCAECKRKIKKGEPVVGIANVYGKLNEDGTIQYTKKAVSIHLILCSECHFKE